ncbi:MAG: sigma-54 dependent transcriptional regulator [Desulfobacterales bacterium]|nr:sigma-54 dependent transcriptional regulator [Desulfobacterales bacterium]
MIPELPRFSEIQWKFLATLEVLGALVPIGAVETLAPLMPSEMLDLIRRAEQHGFLQKTENDHFGLAPNIPADVLKKLRSYNSPDRVSEIFVHLKNTGWLSRLSQPNIIPLLVKAKRFEDAANIQLNLTKTAIDHLDVEAATANLAQVVRFYLQYSDNGAKHLEIEKRMIDHALTVSNLSSAMGKGFTELQPLFRKLLLVSEASGDRRSHAMILLHLGRLHFIAFKSTEFLKALSDGKQIVDELGDDDILCQSAEFVGHYYFVQGDFKQALIHYEKASEWYRLTETKIINPFMPGFFCLSIMALGQFTRAYNLMDIYHDMAMKKNLPNVATTLRTVLGYMLLSFHKKNEALQHLTIAEVDAKKQNNDLGLFGARLFKSYYLYLNGELPEARDLFITALKNAALADVIRPYAIFPWVLEMLFDFDRQQLEVPAEFSFEGTVQRLMDDFNICLKGTAMRLLAKRAAANGQSPEDIKDYLEKSLNFLVSSGPAVQLAKTQLELARFELTCGNREKASVYAMQAWETLPANTKRLFPDDLQHLIGTFSKEPFLKSFLSPAVISSRFAEAMEKHIPALDLKVVLSRLVATTNRFFSAERGAFFLMDKKGKMELAAAVNLTELEVKSDKFFPHSKQIIRANDSGEPLITFLSHSAKRKSPAVNTAVLCLPIDLGNDLQGVLYHDNSFLKDGFDYLDPQTLTLLKTHFQTLSRQIREFYSSAQKKIYRASEKESETEFTLNEKIIGESPGILNLLKKAGRIADTNSPILIQGETGVGKEILARWVHKHCPRCNGPYVVIDSTTIAENLLESELFGHEKGAFTGATHQKTGRVELAHGGTLFLDEVGELPLSMQAKLLRVLEEKTFVRVGGSRVHQCDFRLIAATNRDLEKEVRAGRFREDLFYRLNVLPIQIPPLRERGSDIVLLARHFLGIYCKRLKRPTLLISPKDVSALCAYSWPGNVRELKNVIERGALLSTGNQLELQLSTMPADRSSFSVSGKPSMDELQRDYIRYILKTTDGKVSGPGGAADVLKMKRTTLYYRMKRLSVPFTLPPRN